jgi:choline dehydrogenase-like flavoprotein
VLADARAIADGGTVEYDICVIGAGPIGLTLAHEVAADGPHVCVLESGSLEPSVEVTPPLEGEVDGEYYPPLSESRARGLGGTASIWRSEVARNTFGARYGALGEIDFEQRDDVPHSGWPFERAHLEPHYEQAARICGIGPLSDDPAAWEEPPRSVPLSLGAGMRTRVVRYGPGSAIVGTYARWASRTPHATIYGNARALEIEVDDHGRRATSVLAGSGPDHRFRVSARLFVLALGGIENARLLLLSKGAGATGLGNEHDLVGRFFMDHPTASSLLIPTGARAVERLGFYDTLYRGDRVGMGVLELSTETLRREGLLNSGIFLVPKIERQMRALESLGASLSAVRSRRLPDRPLTALRNVALGADAVAATAYRRLVERWPPLERTTSLWPTTRLLNTLDVGHISGWSRLPFAGRRYRSLGVHQVIEQAPEPERRITLSSAKDAFGQPLPHLHWFISERELDSMRRTQDVLATAFGRAGIGKLVRTDGLAREARADGHLHPTAHHHLGTTRMHSDPHHGVVDDDCRVHTMTNVFVTGTSVFPTAGYINPTLTAVALAVRLADHVKAVLPSLPERSEP